MVMTTSTWRRALAAALVTAGLAAGAGSAAATSPPYAPPYVKSSLVQVDVFDRQNGTALPVYQKDGRHYIVGVPGHEYAVRIRNCTGARILVVTSVDGVNVVSGDTASPQQSGYVLEPWGSVEIAGWRKSLERTAAFYFTDLGDSYAARTGRPQNVGVIGVAVFQERAKRIAWREQDYRGRLAASEATADGAKRERADAPAAPPPPAAAAASPMPAPSTGARDNESAADAARQEYKDEKRTLGKLGTGHGRSEDSRVTVTQFERATSSPAETVAIQYDRRENLVALGVLPRPTPYIARHEPNPFPGALRFAPDPNR
jgi:pyruvate/2-oxoglutarate dehydrogenase complex dihydrolipoamide acyltransferase (E2) component